MKAIQYVFLPVFSVPIRECLFHVKQFSGLDFFSALVDAFLYHSWPSATRDREMHQLVLRKSQTLELPHVEKIHSLLGH